MVIHREIPVEIWRQINNDLPNFAKLDFSENPDSPLKLILLVMMTIVQGCTVDGDGNDDGDDDQR